MDLKAYAMSGTVDKAFGQVPQSLPARYIYFGSRYAGRHRF